MEQLTQAEFEMMVMTSATEVMARWLDALPERGAMARTHLPAGAGLEMLIQFALRLLLGFAWWIRTALMYPFTQKHFPHDCSRIPPTDAPPKSGALSLQSPWIFQATRRPLGGLHAVKKFAKLGVLW